MDSCKNDSNSKQGMKTIQLSDDKVSETALVENKDISNFQDEPNFQYKISKHQEIYLVKIDEFEIVNEIKQNQFCSLFLVKKTNETYIAKVIKNGNDVFHSDKTLIIKLNKLMSIQHPTIITYLGYSLNDISRQNGITIFMNHLQRGSLAKVLNDLKKNHIIMKGIIIILNVKLF